MAHKMLNGIRVELSDEEYAAFLENQRVGHAESVARREAKAATIAQKAIDKANATSKLEALGLTSSEIDALSK